MKKKYYWIGATSLLIVFVMIYNAVSTPGISDLQGNFEEVAFVRNEQNSGPILRVYAVLMDGQNMDEIEQFGNYMPHTKYGTTTVYFFNRDGGHPSSFEAGFELPEKYHASCIARYVKDGMGQVTVKRNPYLSSAIN